MTDNDEFMAERYEQLELEWELELDLAGIPRDLNPREDSGDDPTISIDAMARQVDRQMVVDWNKRIFGEAATLEHIAKQLEAITLYIGALAKFHECKDEK